MYHLFWILLAVSVHTQIDEVKTCCRELQVSKIYSRAKQFLCTSTKMSPGLCWRIPSQAINQNPVALFLLCRTKQICLIQCNTAKTWAFDKQANLAKFNTKPCHPVEALLIQANLVPFKAWVWINIVGLKLQNTVQIHLSSNRRRPIACWW